MGEVGRGWIIVVFTLPLSLPSREGSKKRYFYDTPVSVFIPALRVEIKQIVFYSSLDSLYCR
jgi:hypothetical protein